jgi:phage tail sheath protein FI
MAFQLSPGVNVSEIDLTTIVPQVGTTTGGFVGIFNWGPVDEIKTISNEIDLINVFGSPDANTYESFFTAANFLAYADNLKLVRSVGAAARNAANTGILIKNRDAYEASYTSLSSSANGYIFAAKYPGNLGNSLKVSVCANTAGFSTYPYGSNYNGAPNTSTYVAGVGGSGDEMHITVVDEDGFISGTANTVLERFGYVSKASDAVNEDGSSNYYVNVLTDQSKYVYAIAHAANSNSGVTASGTVFSAGDGTTSGVDTVSLTGGVDASPLTANVQVSYDKFKNADEVDISLIMTGAHSNVVSKYIVDNIAEVRKDCVVFISPAKTDVVNQSGSEVTNITTTRNAHTSSSYAFFDSGWKYQFDKYNNVYRWVPLNGDIASLCVRTDTQRDAWFSPAGFNRGQIKNVTKLSWNPTKSNRDDLYKIGVNSVVTFQGEGTVLYGDKTMLSKPSAFDRINVRRLFIVLEKAIARASKYSLFEFNDEFTRAQFIALVNPYLRDVQGRRGIFDFKVVCDTTNNTPEVIDRNEFVGDIYIKPARSINYIQLNFVAVRTGVAFEEIVGRF